MSTTDDGELPSLAMGEFLVDVNDNRVLHDALDAERDMDSLR